ncbi:MAG: ATP-binding protein [Sandaracinaceae bacterium]
MKARPPQNRLAWRVRLGWIAIVGQLATLAVVRFGAGVPLPLMELGAVIAAAAAFNVGLAVYARRSEGDAEGLVGAALVVDTALLTILLALTGGPSNPFGILYLVHVTLAAILCRPRWTWMLVGLSIASYGALFLWNVPLPDAMGGHHAHHHREDAFSIHLQGMFIAFAMSACLVAWFVTRVTTALAAERERSARHARLAALTTLAAGAAHELATPLATIKVASAELVRALGDHPEVAHALDDALLIRSEVERSRDVLDRLAARSAEAPGEAPSSVALADVVGDAVALLDDEWRARVEVRVSEGLVSVPRRAFARALANLLDNAFDASGPDDRVALEAAASGDRIEVTVRDEGHGMSDEIAARVGEPFFTTKPNGRGMGLGVLLVRALADELGGTLEYSSTPGGGTVARLVVRGAA